jgi:zinc protease
MNTRIKPRSVVAALAVLAFLLPSATAKPLPSDSRVRTGTLDNGFTWKYRQHDNPPGKMAIIMHVRSGSLNEKDSQQGLAHFLEHMAFNGSENFAPGELIPYFESVGMEFGGDLNAFTSFDQTAYMLFLPNTKPEEINKALLVMSDYAYRMLLLDEEIDKERGVVLEESRRGKGAFQRIRDKLWPELFADTRFAVRLPIGKDEILETAKRSEFKDYYRTWYRPENMTLVMVGDVSPTNIIPMIEKQFGQYRPKAPSRKQETPEFKTFTKQRAMVVTDSEMAMCNVGMLNILPGRPPVTTVEQWNDDLVEHIGSWIMGRRFEELVNKGDASFRWGSASTMSFFNDAVLVSGNASGEPQDWNKMLEELIMEVHRAREFGFTAHELDLAKRELLADAERAVLTEPTSNARSFMFQIMSANHDKVPVLSAQQELDLYKQGLPKADLSLVNAAFSEHFKPGSFAYTVEMVEKDSVHVPSNDDVLAAARAAWARKVTPIHEEAAPTDLLASIPTPGKVVDAKTDNELAITSAWLSNGVRVHHRFMDYKEDTVMVTISLAGGEIEETDKNMGVTEVASLVLHEPSTSRLTTTNISDIMTGKNISVRGGGSRDVFMISVSGSPKDLETGMQLANALLTDGKITDAAFKNWRLQSLQRIEMMQTMPMFKAFEASEDLLTGGDPRFAFPTKEIVERQSISRSQKWFDRLCRTSPIEVSVVGEISRDDAMALVAQYIGSLPKRSRTADSLNKLRRVARPTGPLSRHVDVKTVTPKGMSMAGFVAGEAQNTHDLRAMALASNILTSRVVKRIREELSWVYSIRASHRPTFAYKDAGRFIAAAPCDPANAEKVAKEVHRMFEVFAKEGPTEEELTNAKKQIANNLDTQMKEPRYWSGVLRSLDFHKRNLDDEKGKVAAYNRFTPSQVRGTFRKYYTPQRKFSVTATPVKPEASDKENKKAKSTSSS